MTEPCPPYKLRESMLYLFFLSFQVIFTFLKIENAHFSNIVDNGEAGGGNEAKIFYTTPFDFMKAEDRNAMLEILLKLAVVQSENHP